MYIKDVQVGHTYIMGEGMRQVRFTVARVSHTDGEGTMVETVREVGVPAMRFLRPGLTTVREYAGE